MQSFWKNLKQPPRCSEMFTAPTHSSLNWDAFGRSHSATKWWSGAKLCADVQNFPTLVIYGAGRRIAVLPTVQCSFL